MCQRLFGHIEKMENENWVGNCRERDISGATEN